MEKTSGILKTKGSECDYIPRMLLALRITLDYFRGEEKVALGEEGKVCLVPRNLLIFIKT